jgi:DMSO/TMAO reductase YedYZ molybdopterin-dependent catalytic subunit
LAFSSTGLYGKTLPPQNGGPTRPTLPWTYGSGSIRAIVKTKSTDNRSPTFWESILSSENVLWANVNPVVLHMRWSRANRVTVGQRRRSVSTNF